MFANLPGSDEIDKLHALREHDKRNFRTTTMDDHMDDELLEDEELDAEDDELLDEEESEEDEEDAM